MASVAETLRALRSSRRRRGRRIRALLWIALRFPPLFALYLLLVGQVSMDEAIAAALCGLAAAALPLLVSVVSPRHFNLRAVPLLSLGLDALRSAAIDVLRVGMRLARLNVPPGVMQRWRIDGIQGDEPRFAARRGMTTLTASFAPNSYVLAVLSGRGEMLLHQLVEAELPRNPQWPQ